MELILKTDLSTNISPIFEEYQKDLHALEEISNISKNAQNNFHHFVKGNNISLSLREFFNIEGAIKSLNATYWEKVIKLTNVLDVMTADKREEWRKNINECNTPEFNRENVQNTVFHLLDNRHIYLAEKAECLFQNLSPHHKTNSPYAFKEKFILERFYDINFGTFDYHRLELLDDLQDLISIIRKEEKASSYITRKALRSIADEKGFGQYYSFNGGAFKLKLYKKGTAHIEIHESIANELNRMLSVLRPHVIAHGEQRKEKKQTKAKLETNLLSHKLCDELFSAFEFYQRNKRFAKISKELKKILILLGADDSLKFDYDIKEVVSYILRTRMLPDSKSHQYYPTPNSLVDKMLEQVVIESDDDVLEPSAGNGSIAEKLDGNVTCIEISPMRVEILKSKGLNALKGDFLEHHGSYDKIVMNPPFNKNQAKIHIEHAYELLKPGGSLVAIMPASFNDKNYTISESYENKFLGTSVRVVIASRTKE